MNVIADVKNELKSLVLAVYHFIRLDFHLLSYVYTFVVIITAVVLNYHFSFYQNHLLPTYYSDEAKWVYPLFYFTVYMVVAIPVLLFQKQKQILLNPKFYLKIGLIIALYGFSIGYFSYTGWQFPSLTSLERSFVMRCLSQLKCLAFMCLPFLLLRYTVDKDVKGFYGLSTNTHLIKGYLVLLAVLVPFLIATSFTPDFLSAYPQFRPWLYDGIFSMPTWLYTLLFEAAYSVDFVMVEFIFRGLLVIGMVAIMGPKAVLPMVAVYASIHFGKPALETFSSIFGGYILGALAYQTKHIWGGVIVHLGIALTMEIMGFLQFYLKLIN